MAKEYTLGGPPPQSRSEKILMKQNPGPAQSRIEELLKNASGRTSGALIYKGTVETTMSLPSSGNEVGDVYHVNSDGSEWAWNGTTWEELGAAVDLTGYATKAWVEEKGYQTEQQVQTAISGVRQLPAVVASDNGKFLRVVSGSWAAETVQTWQGGSY